jgi:hypothetical protein
MRTIWKYRLEVSDDVQSLSIPREAKIVAVGNQEGSITLWAEVAPGRFTEARTFAIHGTGHPIASDEDYIGTAIVPPFVWHVYEVQK